jgi:hypothetical protein
VTSSERRLSAIDRPLGEMPLARSIRLEERRSLGQRVLNGLSGVRVGGRSQAASGTVSFENDIESNTAMIP